MDWAYSYAGNCSGNCQMFVYLCKSECREGVATLELGLELGMRVGICFAKSICAFVQNFIEIRCCDIEVGVGIGHTSVTMFGQVHMCICAKVHRDKVLRHWNWCWNWYVHA